MLVVVVIIGILAGVLVPRLVGARERASDSGRIVKIWQISSAVELYAQENGSGTYPKAPLSDTPTSVATPSVSSLISPYLTTIPTDPGKGTVAIYNGGGNIMVTGDSFAYWTDTWWTVYAITALMESKKGNTTNAIWVIDKDKEGEYQVVGKGLITYILKVGITHEWNDLIVYDGTNTYIIADKNVWASVAGTWPTSYGYYFQWGNNFWFKNNVPWSVDQNGSTTLKTSTTLVSNPTPPYSRDVFVRWYISDWATPSNDNLRPEKGQWPCDPWYHIPTIQEWEWLYNVFVSVMSGNSQYQTNVWDLWMNTFLLPLADLRSYYDTTVYWAGSNGTYWSSSVWVFQGEQRSYNIWHWWRHYKPNLTPLNPRAQGMSVRCFKN